MELSRKLLPNEGEIAMETYEQYDAGYSRVPAGCTLKDYRKNYASAPLKKSIKTWSIVAYVLVGLNAVIALLVNPWMLLDTVLLLGLTLGVHLNKSKGCAIALLVYTIINAVIGVISSGSVSGWWWIVLAVSYLGTIKKIDEEYKAEMAKAPASGYNDYVEVY